MLELEDVSEEAIIVMTSHILNQDDASTSEAIDALSVQTPVAAAVAERLLTGRRAEEYFIANFATIIQKPAEELLDLRLSAMGYDFGVTSQPQLAIEVKGLREQRGDILFTDREWIEARLRRADYWLAIIRDLTREPKAEIVINPIENILAKCVYQRSVTASWRASV